MPGVDAVANTVADANGNTDADTVADDDAVTIFVTKNFYHKNIFVTKNILSQKEF
jgi:hypothetical protein